MSSSQFNGKPENKEMYRDSFQKAREIAAALTRKLAAKSNETQSESLKITVKGSERKVEVTNPSSFSSIFSKFPHADQFFAKFFPNGPISSEPQKQTRNRNSK